MPASTHLLLAVVLMVVAGVAADHMYRMGMMSLLASDCGVDATRCMKMALVHDVAEAIVGDITPHCSVSDEDKFSLEAAAIQKIKDMLGQHTQAGGTAMHARTVQPGSRTHTLGSSSGGVLGVVACRRFADSCQQLSRSLIALMFNFQLPHRPLAMA